MTARALVARVLAALLGAWLLASAVHVRAETPSVFVVAVADEPSHALDALEVAALARAALAQAEGFRVRPADRVLRGEVEAAHDAYARGLAELRRGRQAYLAFELETALRALESALAAFREAGPVVDTPEPVAETLIYLGASQVLAGELDSAQRTFTRAHTAFAGFAPDVRVFNPEIMAHWQKAGTELAQKGRGKLQVRAPEGAEVTLDGRVSGTGSVTLEGVSPGEHWVRVSVPGTAPTFSVVTLRSKELAVFDASSLAPDPALSEALLAASTSEGAERLRTMLGVDALAVIHVASGRSPRELSLSLTGYGVAGQGGARRVPAGTELADRSQAVSSLVAAFLDRVAVAAHARARDAERDRVSANAPTDVEHPPAEPARPWYKRGWVWAVVGVAVVGGAATAIALSMGGEDTPSSQGGDGNGRLVLEF